MLGVAGGGGFESIIFFVRVRVGKNVFRMKGLSLGGRLGLGLAPTLCCLVRESAFIAT